MRPTIVLAFLLSALTSQADVTARLHPPIAMDDQTRATWRVVLTNHGPALEEDYRFYFSVNPSPVVAIPDVCTLRVVSWSPDCELDIPANSSRELFFTVQYQQPLGHFGAVLGVSEYAFVEYDEAIFGRPYLVTSTADSGPGSLRTAILDINRDCVDPTVPCAVVFQIDGPVPEEGWFTIRPQTALPELTAQDVVIDGSTQSRHLGETNPSGGPEIALHGSAVGIGHGLAFRGTASRVTDLAVGGFTGNGIESSTIITDARRNYLGVAPSGRTAWPNGLRGLQIDGGRARVIENVLSGNRRSGAFFWTKDDVLAQRNLVGVGADGVTPLGNGASGLFFHRPAINYWLSTAEDNVIGYNAHAGIGLSIAASGNFARNTFRRNANGAIDIGLDGPTVETRSGLPGQGGVVGVPVITSARYVNGVTIIEGTIPGRPSLVLFHESVYVYAAQSPDEKGGEFLAVVTPRDFQFTLQVEGDLRGRWVSAASYANFAYNWDLPAAGTSEVGSPRLVE